MCCQLKINEKQYADFFIVKLNIDLYLRYTRTETLLNYEGDNSTSLGALAMRAYEDIFTSSGIPTMTVSVLQEPIDEYYLREVIIFFCTNCILLILNQRQTVTKYLCGCFTALMSYQCFWSDNKNVNWELNYRYVTKLFLKYIQNPTNRNKQSWSSNY